MYNMYIFLFYAYQINCHINLNKKNTTFSIIRINIFTHL